MIFLLKYKNSMTLWATLFLWQVASKLNVYPIKLNFATLTRLTIFETNRDSIDIQVSLFLPPKLSIFSSAIQARILTTFKEGKELEKCIHFVQSQCGIDLLLYIWWIHHFSHKHENNYKRSTLVLPKAKVVMQ